MRQAVLTPCRWMRGLLDLLIEGRLIGPLRWLAELHLRKCNQCTKAHRALLALRDKLRAAGAHHEELLGDDRWLQIEEACREQDEH